jgi:O-antigen/teichoic acid export membrane protein
MRIDQYLIAYYLEPTQVGLYAIAANLTNMILRVPDATGTVLFPRLVASTELEAHAATARVCRHTIFVATLVGLGFLVAGPVAIPLLYGAPFAGAVRPMLILLPGVVVMSLYMILSRNFTSRARQEVNIVAALSALAVNVLLNVMLIPRWGIGGAAFAHTLSYGTAALVLLVVFVRESGRSPAETLFVTAAEVRRLLGIVWSRVA